MERYSAASTLAAELRDLLNHSSQSGRSWVRRALLLGAFLLPALVGLGGLAVFKWREPQWISLASLVLVYPRDMRNANWKVEDDTSHFTNRWSDFAGEISVPLSIEGGYELQSHVTVMALRTTATMHLPVADGRAAVLK